MSVGTAMEYKCDLITKDQIAFNYNCAMALKENWEWMLADFMANLES
jgi:hypothetical protein